MEISLLSVNLVTLHFILTLSKLLLSNPPTSLFVHCICCEKANLPNFFNGIFSGSCTWTLWISLLLLHLFQGWQNYHKIFSTSHPHWALVNLYPTCLQKFKENFNFPSIPQWHPAQFMLLWVFLEVKLLWLHLI